MPNVGYFLGQMTDEVLGKFGSEAHPVMKEFFTIGPKTYSYWVRTGTALNFQCHNRLKAKGNMQTVEASKDCNFYFIRKMALFKANGIENEKVGVA